MAAAWRTGIGGSHELLVNLFHLDNRNGIQYGLPWIRPRADSPASATTVLPLDPTAYYGLDSDRNHGQATQASFEHTWRLSPQIEWVTQLRRGHYGRDQRASTVRLAPASQQADGLAASLATFGPATRLTRGTQLKIQNLDTLYAQSDLSAQFEAWGLKHQVQAGLDAALEQREVWAARSASQGGVNLVKPLTTVGQPLHTGVDEDSRSLRLANQYTSKALGVYAQDLLQLSPHVKALLGLRRDFLQGRYTTVAIPTQAPGPETRSAYGMDVGEWSYRLGALYQPHERLSAHLSAANSFNTSGDAYSLSAANQGIPPEQAINLEAGVKMDAADGRLSVRAAVFRSTKLHERNTDPLLNIVTLSGRRHVVGWEVDLAGRLSAIWEVFGSYMAMPVARIDVSSATSGELQGSRPSLTPRYSGSLWSTFQPAAFWRLGAGLTLRGPQTPIRNPGWEVPGFVVADVMAQYKPAKGPWSMKLNVSNLANKRYADALYSGHYVPGAGRLVQVSAGLAL